MLVLVDNSCFRDIFDLSVHNFVDYGHIPLAIVMPFGINVQYLVQRRSDV